MMLSLLDKNTDLGKSNRILFQYLDTVPEYIDFKREFRLGTHKVILLQLRDRIGYLNSLKYANDMGGRLLRPSEIRNLLDQVSAPLCPYKEMWVVSAYDKWIHVGSYCASLRYKVGIRMIKSNEKDYDIYKKMPIGELGQLYIMGEKNCKQPFKDIDDFLTHFEENSED